MAAHDLRLQIVAAFILILCISQVHLLPVAAIVLAVSVTVAWLMRLERHLWHRLQHVEGFMALLFLMLPLTTPAQPIASIGVVTASLEGLERAALIACKASACVLVLMVMLGQVEASRLGAALRDLGLPEPVARLIAMTARYLQLVRDEARRLHDAMRARLSTPLQPSHMAEPRQSDRHAAGVRARQVAPHRGGDAVPWLWRALPTSCTLAADGAGLDAFRRRRRRRGRQILSALIALEDVGVTRDGIAVLHGATLSLVAGQRLAIVGPNGAGKTTLLRTIVGLEKPASGTVRLFGAACGEERPFRQYRPRIGYLFQDSDDQLFCPTVIEDVAFGPLNTGCDETEAERRGVAALADLGIGHLAERISHRLSGGEKRLVCFAGLLAMKPDVLMLDEPTNGVDNKNGRRLRYALRAFPGAMLPVSHDAAFVADFATRAMIIDGGTLQPAEIHAHAHTHSHLHLHPAPPSAR